VHHGVARGMPGVDQFELGWMGEHRFGDERLAQLDQLGLVTAAMTAASSACAARVIRPALFGHLSTFEESISL
jgi:hypothetical protein